MTNLLLNERPLVILPQLAAKIGLNEAIVLQQVHYWLLNPKVGKKHEGRKWVRNTYAEWLTNFPYWKSEKTIQRAFDNLRSMGLVLIANLNRHAYDKTNWYTIDYDRLDNLSSPSGQDVQMEEDNLSEPIPETTTETTTDNKVESTIQPTGETPPAEIEQPQLEGMPTLEPQTEQELMLFEMINYQRKLKKRRRLTKFPTSVVKDDFGEVCEHFNSHLKEAIRKTIGRGITGIVPVVKYLHGWAQRERCGAPPVYPPQPQPSQERLVWYGE